MKHKITRKKYRYTRRKRLYRRKKCSFKRMNGGEPDNQGCVCILLDSLLQKSGEKHPIGWKDKPLGISLSGNSIFEPHEIKKVRMRTSNNILLSPEEISKYVSYTAITLDGIKGVIPLDVITTKLKKQSESVSTDGIMDDINGRKYKYIRWTEFTVKTTKHAIEPNRLVYCEMVNGKASIRTNIYTQEEDPLWIYIPIDITYRIIVDLDRIIQCVVVDYTINNKDHVQHKNNITTTISNQVIQNLKARLAEDPNSFLTTIPLKLEVPLGDTPSAPQVVKDGSPSGLWVRQFSSDTINKANQMTYTSPSPIQQAAFDRVQKYIQSTVSWNYNDGLCIFRILDSDDKTVAFISITGMINPEDNGLPKSTQISSVEFWVKDNFGITTNDKVNMSYFS